MRRREKRDVVLTHDSTRRGLRIIFSACQRVSCHEAATLLEEKLLVSLDDELLVSAALREEFDQRVKRRMNGESRPVEREEARLRILEPLV